MSKISIIVVCLNPGKKLIDTMESILRQTSKDYEVVVKDGFSKDGSIDLLKEWLAGAGAKIADKEARLRLNDWILNLEYEVNKIPRPDVSLFLDVPFSFTKSRLTEQREGDDRSYLNGATDIHEQSLSLQQRVREVYIESSKRDSELLVVDCSNEEGSMASPDEIFLRIEATIAPLLK